jgi:predicted enzyme related to lactoylglutathione lyase
MKKVTGIGGVFFKSQDPEQTKDWYQKHLGIESDQYGATFEWKHPDNPEKTGYTAWNPFPHHTKYFDPGHQEFMINYRVADLEALLAELKDQGVKIVGEMEEFEYGKFAWIMDPEGQKIELWEPVDENLK